MNDVGRVGCLTMGDPLITVVMSCYNQAKTLGQAVESVLMQRTDFPVRLIVTDDHSTQDESVDLIRAYEKRYPRKIVGIFSDENGRYLANVLRAMPKVSSEYFTLLDADDYWTDPYYLSDAVRFLEKNREYTVYFRNVAWHDDAGNFGAQHAFNELDCDLTLSDVLGGRPMFPQTTGAVFRNVVYCHGIPPKIRDSVGTIHERAYDGDVFRFLLHLSYGKGRFVNKVSGVYRLLAGGVFSQMPLYRRAMFQAQCFLDYYDYFRKNREFFVKHARINYEKAIKDRPGEEWAPNEEFLRCERNVERFLTQGKLSVLFNDVKWRLNKWARCWVTAN